MAEGDCPTDQWIEELQRTRKAADEAGIKLVLRDPSEIAQRDEPYFTQWIGTQETLIERGICTTEQFPAGRKRVAHGHGDDGARVSFWSMQRLRSGICEYTEQYSQAMPQPKEIVEDPTLKSPETFAESVEGGTRMLLRLLKSQMSGEFERTMQAVPRSSTTAIPSSACFLLVMRSSSTCKLAPSHGHGT